MSYEKIQECADYIKARLHQKSQDIRYKSAIVLGSGLSRLASDIEEVCTFDYAELPHFPEPTVTGHSGNLIFGSLGNAFTILMQGRLHAYEGLPGTTLAFPIRVLWALGVETLILTNAAGSLKESSAPGSLMLISDHINFSGVNPLVGGNDERIGLRFPDMSNAWDKDLRSQFLACADQMAVPVSEGVYLMTKGPSFETPAEIRAFGALGADAVGMSTVPECLTARHCGMRVLGISTITNLAAGLQGTELTHEESLSFGAIGGVNLSRILRQFLPVV